jgi:menaquinone-dependent protoporphyrinogen IX oxidase
MDPPPFAEVLEELAEKLSLAHERLAESFVMRFPEHEKGIREAMAGVGPTGDLFVPAQAAEDVEEDEATVRDFFAGQAMQALIARNVAAGAVGETAYRYAEAMMVARERTDIEPHVGG